MDGSPANQRLGRFLEVPAGGEVVRSFIPPPLPPVPPVDLPPLILHLVRAERWLGRLDGIGRTLTSEEKELFLYMYVRKEAVLSSQIEGTQCSLSDLLAYEEEDAAQDGQPGDDIRDVSNYVDAMMHGLERRETLPLSMRLIREMHARLLQGGRGSNKDPGHFRRSQNWIGGTRPGNALFVPPPAGEELNGCLDALETFIHEGAPDLPLLIKAGLIHVQFETLHPFLDGNGRIGRLLVTLFLLDKGVIDESLLYLSLYLKTNRAEYYRRLQEVREKGDWEAWLAFFLTGVAETARQAFEVRARIVELFERDEREIRDQIRQRNLKASKASVETVYRAFRQHPFRTSGQLVASTGLTSPTVNGALGDLVSLNILEETTGRRRGRVFRYKTYLAILDEGTEPLAATR